MRMMRARLMLYPQTSKERRYAVIRLVVAPCSFGL